ncbi:MAG: alpha/beta hydrolase [Vicinamibacterales bacterium]
MSRVTWLLVAVLLSTVSIGAAAPMEGFVDVPGVRLWVTDSGGDGEPLILLHAGSGQVAAWERQIPAFTLAGYRVIAYDRRGWGKSVTDPTTGPQPGVASDDLQALVERLQLRRFHLVGIAAGGTVAIDYAAHHPERLRSLVLSATIGGTPETAAMTTWILQPGFAALPGEFRELGVAYRAANPDGTKRWATIEHQSVQQPRLNQPMRSPQDVAKIATIKTPTLVIVGGADLLAPPALVRLWADHLSNRKGFEILGNAGHAVAWEQPEAYNRLVLSFVSKY